MTFFEALELALYIVKAFLKVMLFFAILIGIQLPLVFLPGVWSVVYIIGLNVVWLVGAIVVETDNRKFSKLFE